MPDRTRPIRKEICLNEQELNLIQHKMRQLGTHNFGAYARKLLIDGYIIKVDYTEQKKLAAAVSRAASNINQICRRINSTGRCYEDDVAELKARQAEIWELLKVRQKDELWTQRDFPCVGFPSPVFRTVDKLTLRSVPQPDFRTTVFVPSIGAEIHPLTNKK